MRLIKFLRQVNLVIATCWFLKPIQFKYQVVNRFRPKCWVHNLLPSYSQVPIAFRLVLPSKNSYLGFLSFQFLNLKKTFKQKIDWNFCDYGKLWTYNLEYFDCLSQLDLSIKDKVILIEDFYQFSIENKRRLEPYPVSLRTINIIKFANIEKAVDEEFLNYTYQELEFLDKNYEFHILGNHLLENCFAMLLGGAFFGEAKWRLKAEGILRKELEEQILQDGAHFELSPMYHQIIFYRILELIDWYSLFNDRDKELLAFLKSKASLMYGWLSQVSFKDGSIPLFSDSAKNITYTNDELFKYARLLGIKESTLGLSISGYRSYSNESYEIKVDFAQVGARYQPGHAHADALSFLMHYRGKPLFVEAGTSTYQIGLQRSYERSTRAHNTVEVGLKDQSQVWSGFRVAKRAKTTILIDRDLHLKGFHNGYNRKVGRVYREYIFHDSSVEILDNLEKGGVGIFYLHLDSDVVISEKSSLAIKLSNGVNIVFSSFINLDVRTSKYAVEFNKYVDSKVIVVTFEDELRTMIKL